MFRHIRAVSLFLGFLIAASSEGATFTFSTGNPNGVMAVASRPDGGGGLFEIEAADDFVTLSTTTTINHATFTGLIPTGTLLTSVSQVVVEIYRVFPQDSNTVRTPVVPTRVNSPSDVAFDFRDSTVPNLTFAASILAGSFTASNSISPGGIHPLPNQTTGGSGPTTGQEVLFDVTFTTPFTLPAGHYFFVPQVSISGGGVFYWLSAPKPIVAPGTPFAPDLQSWTRDAFLDPDWLRVGTDIVGGTTPTFNGAFSLDGVVANSLVVTPVAISPFEAVSFSGIVASFIDADTLQPPGNFTATVDWGDGTTSAGTVTGSAGSFSVSGTHTYADEGSFPVQVTVIDIANSLNASSTGTATVGESDVLVGTGLAITATQGVAFAGSVASFTDTDAANVPGDFTATINWGDTTTTAGVVSGGSGTFLVSGSHTYAGAGTFPVTVTLSDDAPGTATATAVGSASVAAAPVNANASAVPTLGGLGLLILTLSLAAFGALMTRSR